MKKTFTTGLVIIIVLGVLASLVAFSFAWYGQSTQSEESLDYTVDSIEITAITFSMERMAINILPAEGVKYATAQGASFGDVFTGNAVDDNITSHAEVGVIKQRFNYLAGSAVETNAVLEAAATVTALRGKNDDGSDDTVDVNKDVSYLICAQGEGLVLDNTLLLDKLPDGVACWIENSEQPNTFVEYGLALNENFFMLASNADASVLSTHFGIEGAPTQFTVASSQMQLEFLVLVWYNKIDELLDPVLLQTGMLYINLKINNVSQNA